jgi:hypothetical protein
MTQWRALLLGAVLSAALMAGGAYFGVRELARFTP